MPLLIAEPSMSFPPSREAPRFGDGGRFCQLKPSDAAAEQPRGLRSLSPERHTIYGLAMLERTFPAQWTRRLSPLLRLLLLIALSYGMLYYSYKHDDPRLAGDTDFLNYYYGMDVSPLDPVAARPPAIYRQLSAILTHLVYVAGIYYPNDIAFRDPRYDQRVFFAALFTNYVCLIFAAFLAGTIVQHELRSYAFVPATVGGMLCLLSFDTQATVITGLIEGLSWLIFALAFLFYLRRQAVLLSLVLILAIFQREVILVLFAVIAGLAFLLRRDERRLDGFVFVWSLACFAVYFLMRELAPLPFHEVPNHLDPARWLADLRGFRFTKDFIFQGLLAQNLLAIYGASAVLAIWLRRERVFWPLVLLGAFLVLAVVVVAAREDTGLGRLASMMSPAVAAFTAVSWERIGRAAQAA
jgi:hypothetical protein